MKCITVIIFTLSLAHSGYGQGITTHRDTTTITKQPPPSLQLLQPVPDNFYAQHLGFFCRQELKMQQAKVPVTFRLGNMDECNRLEQKPGYR